MGNIGSGSGSSYPGTLDTQTAVEVDSPAAGKTKARAAVPNDLAAAVIAIETELGTDPAGSLTNVKTFLQTEHTASGTHGPITTASAITSTLATGTAPLAITSTTKVSNLSVETAEDLSMNGEASVNANASSATIDLGTVTSGDRIFVSGGFSAAISASSVARLKISKNSGTATIVSLDTKDAIESFVSAPITMATGNSHTVSGVFKVTVTGTLVLLVQAIQDAGTVTTNNVELYAFFLKKQ